MTKIYSSRWILTEDQKNFIEKFLCDFCDKEDQFMAVSEYLLMKYILNEWQDRKKIRSKFRKHMHFISNEIDHLWDEMIRKNKID